MPSHPGARMQLANQIGTRRGTAYQYTSPRSSSMPCLSIETLPRTIRGPDPVGRVQREVTSR